jgi:hypothetical protein
MTGFGDAEPLVLFSSKKAQSEMDADDGGVLPHAIPKVAPNLLYQLHVL